MTRVVGLTGGIGCGKSTVAKLLAELGAEIIDADALARAAVAPGSAGLAKIVDRFGEGLLDGDGALDRAAMGRLVFGDADARRDLEAIIHPEVRALSMRRIAEHIEAGAKLIVYEVPLLYETGLDAGLPEVVVVTVPGDVQRARIAERDGLDAAAIEARIAAQMPLLEKVARADHVIDNGGSFAATRDQVEALWARLSQGGTQP